MPDTVRWWIYMAIMVLLLGSCPAVDESSPVPAPPATPATSATPEATPQEESMPPTDATPAPIVSEAIADLQQRLDVDESAIEVVRFEQVTWPDTSNGCPQPGMGYAQILVEGAFIQLRVADRTYNYHSGRSGEPFLCTSPMEVIPDDLTDETPTNPQV
jgi:hypothetical protein